MKSRILITFVSLILLSIASFAHERHESQKSLRSWTIRGQEVQGSFLTYRHGLVQIEGADHHLITRPLSDFSDSDRIFIESRITDIRELNTRSSRLDYDLWWDLMTSAFLILAFVVIILVARQQKIPIGLSVSLLIGITLVLTSFTDPVSVNKAFAPFSKVVNTFWDNQYFYIESTGIPQTHPMMVGISDHGWQQQVPIPQCYVGSNVWKIPLNPVIANNPIPVDEIHFTRGAIAIAVNGVPIFNPHTNTGVDAFLDGQLDEYGGHSGRADDYHYHTAPLHLSSDSTSTLPIAYAFDGFAVFGRLEPDGADMSALDSNHGHLYNGLYHYHGTTDAPYMIANMVGQVTEDATHQLIPQAAAHPVRTEDWKPLGGALITSCIPNAAGNGYEVSYSLNGNSGYGVGYSWSGTKYDFRYKTPSGTTTKSYNGFEQCAIGAQVTGVENQAEEIRPYPNPFTDHLEFSNLPSKGYWVLTDELGRVAFSGTNIRGMNWGDLKSGVYILSGWRTKKIYRLVKE